MRTGRRGDPTPDAALRVILDECVAPTAEVTAEIARRVGHRPAEIVALASDHSGMPDVVILDRMLGPSTLLVTRDRVLHNLALGRGFRSLVHTPETGWTDRVLPHVAVRDKHLPVPTRSADDDFFAPMTGDVLVLNRILNGVWSERQQKHFRTKRRRIRAHFGSRETIGAVAITIAQRTTRNGLLGGYKMKVDARHGVKGLFPASEGYFLDAHSGAHPLAATCWALSHLHALHLTSHPLTLYQLDDDSRQRTAALLAGHPAARDSIDHMTARLLSAIAAPPKLESCVKGFFFDQMAGKLTQLARGDSNEVVPVELQAMAESIADLGVSAHDDTSR